MRQCPKCLAEPPEGSVFCPADGARLAAPDPLLGALLDGKYDVTALLGRGGMGAVYRATQRALGREVAIKVVRDDALSNRNAVRRFDREAAVLARLRHPNVISVYDFGWAEGVGAYLVMELLSGRSLRAEIDERGRLPLALAADVLGQVCAGLAAAHAAGVVHRDLKPDNIFLEGGPDAPAAKVLDFGIAKVQTQTADEPLTVEGAILGTALYMSPEQIEGECVDRRSDIYSLGCVLYEMLTGRTPFPSPTVAATLVAHLTQTPRPPSAVAPGVPAGVDAVVLAALAKAPARRFDDCDALRAAFAAAAAHAPAAGEHAPSAGMDAPTAGAPSLADTAEAPPYSAVRGGALAAPETLPAGSPAGALAAETVVAGALDSVAVLPLEFAEGDVALAAVAAGVFDQLVDDLSALPALRVTARSAAARYRGAPPDPVRAGQELGVRAVVAGWVALRAGKVAVGLEIVDAATGWRVWGERYSREVSGLMSLQDEIASDVARELRARAADAPAHRVADRHSADNEAYQDYLKGRYFWNKRPQAARESLESFTRATERDPGYALAHAGLAAAYAAMGSWESGLLAPRDAMPRARAAAARSLAIDGGLAEGHAVLGYVNLHFDWDGELAGRELRAALAADPHYATAHHWNAHYQLATGRPRRALESSKLCLSLEPLDLVLNAHLAWHYVFAHEYGEAVEQCGRLRALEPNYFWSFYFLGLALEQLGRLDESIDAFRRAVDLSGSATHSVSGLARVHALAGDGAKAKALLDSLEVASKGSYVPAYDLAVVWAALGEADAAFERLEAAREERSSWVIYLGTDPRWGSLRGDPRFDEVARRVGIHADAG